MADSMTSVGTITHYSAKDPNWASSLAMETVLSRRMMSFLTGSMMLEPISNSLPLSFELSIQCNDKQEQHTLIDFFTARYGRWRRFWIKHPESAFKLKLAANSGATGIYCDRNRFDLVYQGYERIYIEMSNGDLIVRKVTACVDTANSTYLALDSPLDRDVTLTNHTRVGRYMVSRFNNDRMSLKFASSLVATAALVVMELVGEYYLAD